jgi:hypothetical protein
MIVIAKNKTGFKVNTTGFNNGHAKRLLFLKSKPGCGT